MSMKVLIIEDEALLGREMQRRFVKQGWDVVLSSDLADARRQLVDNALRPVAVLADMNLPDGNSLDLLDELQKEPGAGSEWIFLTAFGTIPDSVRALQLGAHDFIEKPVDFEALRTHGFSDDDIWDIGAITAFFGLSNRLANLSAMRPNDEFYLMGRVPRSKT